MMRRVNIKELFQNRKILYFTLCIILISVLSLTIVYAALSVTLNITGSTEVTASNWNIYLANPEVKSGSVNSNVPTISGNNLSFSVNLATPGDYYEFRVDVVNDGSIDAMIDSVVKTPELTASQAKYIKYEVSYQNGESITTNQTIKSGTSTPIKVRLEYRKDISSSDLPSSATELSLRLTLVYVQSDGSGSDIPNNGASASVVNVVSGDGTQVGNEVCIKEECFYVMYSDETTVTMLAKYNLYVGNIVDEGVDITPLSNPTGIQHEDARGGVWDDENAPIFPFIGTTAFSNTRIDYSESIVEGYVNSYNSYLISQGVTSIEARLITKDELINFGCTEYGYGCRDAPEWVYGTSYWTGSVDDTDYIWIVDTNANFVRFSSYSYDVEFGVRPVITISRDLINSAGDSITKQLVEFTIDGIKYQVEEGMTWGEWIDSDYNIDGFKFDRYGFVSSDGHHLLLQCVDSASVIDKNVSYTVYPGDMICDDGNW